MSPTIKTLLTMTISALSLLPVVPSPAAAAYRPPTSLDWEKVTIVVHANGSHERLTEYAVSIESELGASERGEQIVQYNSSLETVDILEAYTLLPNGERIRVPADGIRTTEEELTGGAPMFSDVKNKVVVFPKVQVGAKLYLKIKSVQHTPHFERHFFETQYFSPHSRYGNVEIRLAVHPDRKIHTSARGVTGGLIQPTKEERTEFAKAIAAPEGYRLYRFQYAQSEAVPSEPGQIHHSHFASHLLITTFADYLEVAKSYEKRAANKVRVTPEVATLAAQITQGISDPREQAKALYYWVTKNIRYVAIYLGDGGFEPHDVQTILDARYGDCKDYVVVLQSLLLAKGIASSPALINSGSAPELSPVAVTAPLNHVILYLPSFDLFLDPTAQFAPFSVLPDEVMDKPAVLTSLNKIVRTPKMVADDHGTDSDAMLTMREDGTIQGATYVLSYGIREVQARARQFDRGGRSPDRVVREVLGRFNETGTGAINDSDPMDFSKRFALTAHFELDAPANVPGPAAITLPIGLSAGRLAGIAAVRPPKERKFPTVCVSETINEKYTLRFPNTIKVIRIPTQTMYMESGITYKSDYELKTDAEGAYLQVKRTLVVERPKTTCGQEDAQAWVKFHRVLQRDIRSQIFYE